MTPNPSLNPTIHHVAPDFTLPTPEEVEASNGHVILDYGSRVTRQAAETSKYLSDNSVSLPLPELLASYTYLLSQIEQNQPEDLHTYVFCQCVPGEPPHKVWSTLDADTKLTISHELGNTVNELRALPAPSCIVSVNDGPVLNYIVEQLESKGPYPSVAGFHTTLAQGYARIHKGQVFRYAQGLLNAGNQYRMAFTHADLRKPNVMIDNGHIPGIVDWKMAGWYPEYWEFAKFFTIYSFRDGWANYILDVFQPYYAESVAHACVSHHLW